MDYCIYLSQQFFSLIFDNEADVDNVKVEIEKIKESLVTVKAALENINDREENKNNLEQLTTLWIRYGNSIYS